MADRQEFQSPSEAALAGSGISVTSLQPSPSPLTRRLVDVLLDSEPIQRPALARRAGIPRQTVSELMAGLERLGVVHVVGHFSGHPGRSGLSYAVAPAAAVAMAFDIGGTKIAAGLVDMRGEILAEAVEATSTTSLAELLTQLERLAGQLCSTAGVDRYRLRRVVAGVPGATSPTTQRISMASNLRIVAAPDLADQLERKLGCAVRLENDVNLALIAERQNGVGRGLGNMAFVALGTGIGAGLMVDGRLLRGYRGGAGEIAFLPQTGRAPGPQGAFETAVGAPGIAAAYRARGGREGASVEAIFEAAESGEKAAIETLAELANRLAFGIAALASIADPELLVMGGSIGARPELIARVRTALPSYMRQPVEIRPASHGARAGLVGALNVARVDLLDGLFGVAEPNQLW